MFLDLLLVVDDLGSAGLVIGRRREVVDFALVFVFSRFYVVRGQVEKEWKREDGATECMTHSSGLLFGITDAMLAL